MVKFLPEIGACFGSAILAPAGESSAAALPQRQIEEEVALKYSVNGKQAAAAGASFVRDSGTGRGRLNKELSTKQWKPALAAIAEDNVASDLNGIGGDSNAVANRSDKKSSPSTHVKSKSTVKNRCPSYTDNRKPLISSAVPAFSPTPFLF